MWKTAINTHTPNGLTVCRMTVNGTRLDYLEQGAGPPLVALHGAMSDMRVWHAYAPLLGAANRFVAYTQRHFGPTGRTAPPAGFSRDGHVADLIGFIEELNAGPVHLLTWSYGGDVAVHAMLQRPDLFRSAVHYEPSVGVLLDRVEGGAEAQAAFVERFEPAVTALQLGEAERAAFLFVDAVAGWPPGTAVKEPEPFPGIVRDSAHTLPAFLQLDPGPDITDEQLAGLAVPSLVVHGERTHARYRLIATHLAARLAKAKTAALKDVGHDGPYWAPGRISALVAQFHAGLEPA